MGIVDRGRGWLRASRSHQFLAGATALAVVAAAVAVPLALGGGEAIPTFPPGACGAPPEIRPVAVNGPAGWRDLALPAEPACFRLTPTERDAAGVALDARFVLESPAGVGLPSLEERLRVGPRIAFDVERQAGGGALGPGESAAGPARAMIRPKAPLAEDTVYRFTLLDRPGGRAVQSWAFQTQGRLRVVQTLPADRSTDVPINVGIELTFSHDGVAGVEERLAIDPPVQGRFETHKRTVVFVPKALRRETLYTVTLGAEARIPGSDRTIERDVTFRFETGSAERGGETISEEPALQFTRSVWESPTAEAPALGLFHIGREEEATRAISLPFSVYRLRDTAAFLESLGEFTAIPGWARLTRGRFVSRTAGLDKVASFNARLRQAGPYGELFVQFPEPLPPGYYLAQTALEGDRLQAWLQVTDLASYVSLSGERTLVWVNDIRSTRPLAGATVRVAGGRFSATTGGDGVAFFETPPDLVRLQPSALGFQSEDVRNLTVTAPDGRDAVVPLADVLGGSSSFEFREFAFSGDPGLYWRFLYTDRHLYRQTDTVNFWGLLRLRRGPLRAQRVVVEIAGGEEGGGETLVARTTVTTSDLGTFIGRLALKGTSPGFYQLRARVGDQVVDSTFLEVRDFVTPAYKIDVVPSRRAVFDGDPVRFDISTSFFEGTPVPGVRLRHVGARDGRVTTDARGRASLTYRAAFDGDFGAFTHQSLEVTPALAEEGEITGAAGVQVFAAALTLESSVGQAAGRATVTGTAHQVDLSRLNGPDSSEFDYRGRPAAGRAVTAQVVEISFRRVEEGEYYDFIAKAVRKRYRYEQVERPHGTFRATTDDAGRFTISFPSRDDRSYTVTLAVTDDEGRTFREHTFVSSGFEFGDFPHLALADRGPIEIGDRVELAMRRGASDLPAGGENRYLFYLGRTGSARTSSSPARATRSTSPRTTSPTWTSSAFASPDSPTRRRSPTRPSASTRRSASSRWRCVPTARATAPGRRPASTCG